MDYRRLGKSGLQVSELSFGSWITFGNQIKDNTSEKLMKTAYDAGINFFDNAEIYADGESEKVMGEILKKMGWSRDSYVLSSKVFFGAGGKLPTQKGLHRKHVVEACNDALKRLKVEYLDLYFCHRPDKQTPIEETVWTMHNLIHQGKIMYWGTSEWSAQEIMEAHMVARQYNLIGPTMEQPQYNMLVREKVEVEFSQIYKTVGLGTTIWSPLASGVLSGKYNDGKEGETRLKRAELSSLSDKLLVKETLEKVKKLSAFAKELGMTMPQLGVSWCLKNENVSTVILGASKTSQLEENLKATDKKDLLTEEAMGKIDKILGNKPKQPAF
ncbi:aldo/keto reductase [Cryomorpha ignava]|uniref:Aldo/keto reductase n=1 Tax=Cryomorpha ignava TaxID=101383 RepID=A0A7K3WSY1_9FLAO|nr:aldo/keto reductase [Cryomorpha ignava]NEN24797.1 aldo/keto reductase [Cryomorpha ignava]